MNPLAQFNNFAKSKRISTQFSALVREPILRIVAKFDIILSLTFGKISDLLKTRSFFQILTAQKFNDLAKNKHFSMQFLRPIKDPILQTTAKFDAILSRTLKTNGNLLKAPRFLTC